MGAFKIGGLAMQVKKFCKCSLEENNKMLGVPFEIKEMSHCCDVHVCMTCGTLMENPIVIYSELQPNKQFDMVIEQQLCIPLNDPDVAKENQLEIARDMSDKWYAEHEKSKQNERLS